MATTEDLTAAAQRTAARPDGHACAGGVSRRCVLHGGAVAAGVLVLAACASDDGGPGGSGTGGGTGGSGGSGGDGGAAGLVALADVPVGGAVVVESAAGPLVVAQPSEGEVVAFSAVCTHQGCTVQPDDEGLVCPCHGSLFDVATGENLDGPAPEPLPAAEVEVRDGRVHLA